MPNWCEGVLKVRGTKKDVVNFLENGLKAVDGIGNSVESKFYINEYDEIKYHRAEKLVVFWIKGSKRGFIEVQDYDFDFYDEKNDDVIVCLRARFAWNVDVKCLEKLSKQYNIAFRMYAFERGMEFNVNLEINKGKIITEDYIECDNYVWDCIDPSIGG